MTTRKTEYVMREVRAAILWSFLKGEAMAIERDTLSTVTRKIEILCRNLKRRVHPVGAGRSNSDLR